GEAARFGQVLALASRQVVEHHHLMVALEQRPHHVRTDEAGPARHERPQASHRGALSGLTSRLPRARPAMAAMSAGDSSKSKMSKLARRLSGLADLGMVST